MKTSSEHRRPSASHEPWRAAGLRKGRRYGISRQAIDRATERRLAGDWRGACEAAGIDVEFDLDTVRNDHGTEFTEQLLDDLHHLVPDLARLHMPRSWKGLGLLLPEQPALLSRPGGPDGPWLTLKVEPWDERRSRRPVLGLRAEGPVPEHWLSYTPQGKLLPYLRFNVSPSVGHWGHIPHVWETSRHLWDIRRVHEARERWGGNSRRAPFLNPDGTPRPLEEMPGSEPADPAARSEWIDDLHQAGQVTEAFAAAGIEFAAETAPAPESRWSKTRAGSIDPVAAAARLPLSLARVPGELRQLSLAGLGTEFFIPYSGEHRLLFVLAGDTVRAGFAEFDMEAAEETPVLPEVCWARPPDVDVLRDGMSPDELHPLVREAIAPDHVPGTPPEPAFADRTPVRVRCQGEWHEVTPTRTGLEIPHDGAEQTREASLRAFGGRASGCHAVRETWATGGGWLPRALRERRDDLFERVGHGDTDAVLRYLDGGGDPNVRNAGGQTLQHHLALLDHAVLIPRLLAAGADFRAEDLSGEVPLDRIGRWNADPDLKKTLLDMEGGATHGPVQWPDWA
ncbi:hypothetical protein [Nocardiopsis sp. NPDC057823]|uniref:hypothetical protein n=1 Tax=Nocardiopsis sp. NPDC057823 TaxID=3346256 RepID=UPI0036713CB1